MKRPIFIIAGVVLVFILLGVWIYILFFGTPENGTFGNLRFGDSTDTTVVLNDLQDEQSNQPVVDVVNNERLRQLTTKPTVGYQVVQVDASSTPTVYYVESGTGHVFSINTETGEESRVSSKTIPLSRKAAITPNGQYVIIQSGSGAGRETFIVNIGDDSNTQTVTLTEKIVDFVATTDNTFLYSAQTNDSTIVKHYYPISDTSETVFTTPFREATIRWGSAASDTHYIYPKTTSQLEGFVYAAGNGKLNRIPVDGYGLSAYATNDYVLYSKQTLGQYKTHVYNQATGDTSTLSFTVIPEKCTAATFSNEYIICASEGINVTYDINIPDNWYKGVVTYSDNIWQINTAVGGASLLLNTIQESGRQLDMVDLRMIGNNANIYFLNKNDQTLWLFEQFPTS
tara:strand:+ start:6168 stop:7364 length:1197 start_codon:yes stop_codon:yes gene_type:complete